MSQLQRTEPDQTTRPAEPGQKHSDNKGARKPEHRGGAKTGLQKGHPDTGEKGEKKG